MIRSVILNEVKDPIEILRAYALRMTAILSFYILIFKF